MQNPNMATHNTIFQCFKCGNLSLITVMILDAMAALDPTPRTNNIKKNSTEKSWNMKNIKNWCVFKYFHIKNLSILTNLRNCLKFANGFWIRHESQCPSTFDYIFNIFSWFQCQVAQNAKNCESSYQTGHCI